MHSNTVSRLDRLIGRLAECLTPESARRILKMKADRELQSRVNALSRKNAAGKLSDQERDEYGRYVSYSTFVAILKSKARLLLSQSETSA